MNKLNWSSFFFGLLAGIAIAWAVGAALLLHERGEHAAAIRDLLDCAVTTGWVQAPGPEGGLVWLPINE